MIKSKFNKNFIFLMLLLIIGTMLVFVFRAGFSRSFDCSDLDWGVVYMLGKPEVIDPISIGEARFLLNKGLQHGIAGNIKKASYYIKLAREADNLYSPVIGTEQLLSRISKRRNPQRLVKYMFRGLYYINKKDFRRAIREQEKAARIDPSFTPAYTDLGISYKSIGEVERAKNSFKKAIELNPEYPEPHFLLGVCYFDNFEKEKALLEFEKCAAISPLFGPAHFYLGIYYQGNGSSSESLEHFNKAAELTDFIFPESISKFIKEQEKLKPKDSKFEGADYVKAKIYSQKGTGLAIQGEIGAAQAEFKKALEYDKYYNPAIGKLRLADKFINKEVSFESALYHFKGMHYVENKSFDDAIIFLEKALLIDPASSLAYTDLGVSYMGKGEFDKAEEALKKAVKFGFHHPTQHFLLGVCYQRKGRIEDGIREFKTALSVDPDFVLSHYILASYYYSQKEYLLAKAHFGLIGRPEVFGYDNLQGFKELSSLVAAHQSYGAFSSKQRLSDEFDCSDLNWAITYISGVDNTCSIQKVGVKNIEEARQDIIAQARFHTNNALCFAVKGDFKNCDLELKKALSIDRYYSPATGLSKMVGRALRGEKRIDTSRHLARGIYYMNKKDFEKAINEFNKSLAIEEDNFLAYTDLAVCYLLTGKVDNAIDELVGALKKFPTSCNTGMSHYLLGVCYQNKGKSSLAIRHFKKALKFNPDFALPYNNLAYEYYKLSDYKLAAKCADKAIGLGYVVRDDFLRKIEPYRSK